VRRWIDYIDREAAIDTLYDNNAITMTGVKLLNRIPAANVIAVQFGYNMAWDRSTMFECSVCHWSCSDTLYGDSPYRYCPNCGARMDGGPA